MQTKTKNKNRTGNKPAPVFPDRKPDNIFDLIFGLDVSFLKIMAEEGSSK
jgi:hypothetical protein